MHRRKVERTGEGRGAGAHWRWRIRAFSLASVRRSDEEFRSSSYASCDKAKGREGRDSWGLNTRPVAWGGG
jgi:hypothetical protein